MASHPVDVLVGNRIRQRRALLGMSQTALGKAVGLTFQQIQKYERGANRASASKLYEFATVLDVPVSFFFESAVEAETTSKRGRRMETIDEGVSTKRETLELVRAFYKIRKANVRREILDLIKAVG
ncbi:helix-turn-helix domain-containing protein [Reyranella massiliensis]|uniref:helix-turn-helix domain-containing protein n=1 Tax=Reyranella massiliensis TaxID=445220 RepID=UPI0006ACD2A4|nr:helix-turn-helix transcriptional regulator [Reyranella massiliensis]